MDVMLAVGHVDAPRSYDSVDRPDVRVLRVYHAGRSEAHRARDRALVALGASVTLVVPAAWAGPENTENAVEPGLDLIELEVIRAGDVNRHRYREPSMLARVIADVRPDVLDVHEEPFSVAARQWLSAAPPELPIVMYTAQNIDKRFPPPFSGYERRALRRVACLYPCSRQAASVARRKGFAGIIRVIPLGVDAALFRPGKQSLDDPEVVLGLFGRLVREKGVQEAVYVLARSRRCGRRVSSSSAKDPRRKLRFRWLVDWVSTRESSWFRGALRRKSPRITGACTFFWCRASLLPHGPSNSDG